MKPSIYGEIAVFALPSMVSFGIKACEEIGIALGKLNIKKHSDGEWKPKFKDNVRQKNVFIICSLRTSDEWIQLLLTIDDAMRASAARITVVVTYYGYARQEKKAEPRVPIAAALWQKLMQAAGACHIIFLDLHSAAIQGFCDVPADHLWASPTLMDVIHDQIDFSNLVIVSPDVGALPMVKSVCGRYHLPWAVLDKRRSKDGEISDDPITVIGDVKGKDVLIIDDIGDTCNTVCKGEMAVKDAGAIKSYAAFTHPVLSGNASINLSGSGFEQVWVTDSVPLNGNQQHPLISVVSVAPLIGKAILITHLGDSISELFPEHTKPK